MNKIDLTIRMPNDAMSLGYDRWLSLQKSKEAEFNFKVGDSVELIYNSAMSASIGAKATVVYITKYLGVRWKRDEYWNDQQDGGYDFKNFKIIKPTGKKTMSNKLKKRVSKRVPSWDNLQVGDFITLEDGFKRRILGTCDEVFFYSNNGKMSCDETYQEFYKQSGTSSKVYFKNSGYKVIGAEYEKTVLTMDQIAQKFGLNVKNLTIKKQ